MLLKDEIPSSVRVTRSKQGEVRAWLAAPNVLMTTSHGYLGEDIAESVMAMLDEVTAGLDGYYFFADTLAMKSYAPEYREAFTTWLRNNRPRVLRIHVLFQSRGVHLAVSIINLVTGGIISPYSRRVDFDRQLTALCEGPKAESPLRRAASQ